MPSTTTSTSQRVMVDTDVFSYILNGRGLEEPYLPDIEGRIALLSFQTVAEVLAGAYMAQWTAPRLSRLDGEFRKYATIHYNYNMIEWYAKLKSNDKQMGTGDVWIAASALFAKCPLVTNNWAHYEPAQDLGLEIISHAPGAPRL